MSEQITQTEGGTYVARSVNTGGGDFVGRDQYIGYTSEQVTVLLTQISTTFQPKPFDGRCPYVGLVAFGEQDADRFFGRERLVAELVARVQESRCVVIAGPSGSGKSSLVRAGLVHQLKQGALHGSEHWLYESLKPGRNPLDELGRVASSLADRLDAGDDIRTKGKIKPAVLHEWADIALKDDRARRAVILVDQFEETFTQVANESECEVFLSLLIHAATVEHGRVVVLFTLRSDFVTNCATYPQLNALLNQQFMQIGAMQPDELVSAIALPALQVGLRIDPDLIAQIVNDMQNQPGALPLMQFALKDLFDAQQAKGGVIALTQADYLARGGVHKALERHADTELMRLSEPEQRLTQVIFTGLIEIGPPDTRRTASFDELVPAGVDAASVQAVFRKLADARLVTTDEQDERRTVTLAHETLIDAWPWLRRLVNENRDAIALQNQIVEDAQQWESGKRDASYLYTGARLTTVQEQLAAQKLNLSRIARTFVEAGITAREITQRTRQRRLRAVIIGLTLAVLVFAGLAGFARRQTQLAQAESTRAIEQQHLAEARGAVAFSRQLAAQAATQLNQDPPLALLLSVEAFQITNTVEARGALLTGLTYSPHLATFLHGHQNFVSSVAFSPDGKTLASGSCRDWSSGFAISLCAPDEIRLWSVETGEQLAVLYGDREEGVVFAFVTRLAFSRDNKILASQSDNGPIMLWDVASEQKLGPPPEGERVVFSEDGQFILASTTVDGIVLKDASSGQFLGPPISGVQAETDLMDFMITPDGQVLLATRDSDGIVLWNVADGKPLGPPILATDVVTLRRDGQWLASADEDGSIALWDVANGQPLTTTLVGHTGRVTGMVFSPDSTRLASSSMDKSIILWNLDDPLLWGLDKDTMLGRVEQGQQFGLPFFGHTDSINSVAFSPNGTLLASGASNESSDHVDNHVILWDIVNRQPFGHALTSNPVVNGSYLALATTPDGQTILASVGPDGVALWDTKYKQPLGPPLTDSWGPVAFNSDGRILASGSTDNSVVLWNVASGQRLGQLAIESTENITNAADAVGDRPDIDSFAFSPDDEILAALSSDGTIRLWNVATQRPLGSPFQGAAVSSTESNGLIFSSDGQSLAYGADRQVILLDVATIEERMVLTYTDGFGVAISPDFQTFATLGDYGNIIPLLNMKDGQSIGRPLSSDEFVESATFSPDGTILASGTSGGNFGGGGHVSLWDVATRQRLGRPLPGPLSRVLSVVISSDGKTLAALDFTGTIIIWDLDPASLIARACRIANRNLSKNEWSQYLSDIPYRQTCPQIPEGK